MNQKQTVKIYLAEGNPTGFRMLELFNWSGKGFIIPRESIETALRRDELAAQGVYMLIGGSRESEQELYIGESENMAIRLKGHNREKDFWDVAICFFSTGGNLNKAHVKYLEELLIGEALDAGRAHVHNGNRPQQTKLSESEREEASIFAGHIKLILSAVGYTFLKEPVEYEEEIRDVYICEGPSAYAQALYTSEGVVVLEGSLVRKEFVPSVEQADVARRKQQELLQTGVLIPEGDNQYKFTKKHVFSSPSIAATLVLSRRSNGWTDWKRQSDGKTLDEVIRQEK